MDMGTLFVCKVFLTFLLFLIIYSSLLLYYLLVIISGDPISYKNKVIHIETELVELRIKRQTVIINFNILLLKKDKAVLGIP